MSYETHAGEHVDHERPSPPWKLLLLLIVVAAMVTFFFQNFHDSEVNFLWMSGEFPQWIVIGISALAGILIGRLATWQWRRARRS